jgi:dTDP-4-amino-4,6-dideoxygalactose transaminase
MIRLSKSSISEAEKKAVMLVLDKEYLGMGQEVHKFEEKLTDFFERPVVCVANGTSALHLSCQALGIGAGDEVLVQSLTYIASFQAISATGATPIACDINPSTLTINLEDARKRITSKTKAIMPVHYAGGVGDLDSIYDFAHTNGLRVIEDAAHAFGSFYKGKHVGGFGDIACFSFDGIKNITSGEGGCIVSDDIEFIEKIKDARLLGVEKDSEKRFQNNRSWEFDVTLQGWRYHMSNIMAAIGIEQLKKFPKMAKKRQELAKKYELMLRGNPDIELLKHNYDEVVPHIYVIKCNPQRRDLMRSNLFSKNIQTGIHYQPNHLLSLYKGSSDFLPEVEDIYPKLLSLPLHVDLSEKNVELICQTLVE